MGEGEKLAKEDMNKLTQGEGCVSPWKTFTILATAVGIISAGVAYTIHSIPQIREYFSNLRGHAQTSQPGPRTNQSERETYGRDQFEKGFNLGNQSGRENNTSEKKKYGEEQYNLGLEFGEQSGLDKGKDIIIKYLLEELNEIDGFNTSGINESSLYRIPDYFYLSSAAARIDEFNAVKDYLLKIEGINKTKLDKIGIENAGDLTEFFNDFYDEVELSQYEYLKGKLKGIGFNDSKIDKLDSEFNNAYKVFSEALEEYGEDLSQQEYEKWSAKLREGMKKALGLNDSEAEKLTFDDFDEKIKRGYEKSQNELFDIFVGEMIAAGLDKEEALKMKRDTIYNLTRIVEKHRSGIENNAIEKLKSILKDVSGINKTDVEKIDWKNIYTEFQNVISRYVGEQVLKEYEKFLEGARIYLNETYRIPKKELSSKNQTEILDLLIGYAEERGILNALGLGDDLVDYNIDIVLIKDKAGFKRDIWSNASIRGELAGEDTQAFNDLMDGKGEDLDEDSAFYLLRYKNPITEEFVKYVAVYRINDAGGNFKEARYREIYKETAKWIKNQ